MSHAGLAATMVWFVVFVYALAGSVDFGATFWKMVFAHRDSPQAEATAEGYVTPLWEATNVFLVMIAVALVGFFPNAAYVYGSLLLVPGTVALVLIALRGAFLSFGYANATYGRRLTYVSGLTAILIPSLLVAVLPISLGGYVREVDGRLALDLGALLTSPSAVAYVVFGLAAELFLSAAFLADYAHWHGREAAYRQYRLLALVLGPVTIIAGLAALFLIPSPAWFHARVQALWPWFVASLAFFAAGLAAYFLPNPGRRTPGRPRWSVVAFGLQFALAHAGYGIAHAPYLLYPFVTLTSAFTGDAMFGPLVWVVVIGLTVLTPAFIWLWRLFIVEEGAAHR